jgi:hypothetical protein
MHLARVLLVGSLLWGGVALADDKSDGCGLGQVILGTKASLLMSSLRSSTNYVVPKAFGMTSGTSGCAKHSLVWNQERKQLQFLETNIDMLAFEAATGQGEYLASLAVAFGCGAPVVDAFGQALRKGHAEVFAPQPATDRLQRVKKVIQSNPTLALGCPSVVI